MECVSYKHRWCSLRSSQRKARQEVQRHVLVLEIACRLRTRLVEVVFPHSAAAWWGREGHSPRFVPEEAVSKCLGPSVNLHICEFSHHGPDSQRGAQLPGPSGRSGWCDEPSGKLATNHENPLAYPKLRSRWGGPPGPFFLRQIPWDVSDATSFPRVSFLLSDSPGLNSSIW